MNKTSKGAWIFLLVAIASVAALIILGVMSSNRQLCIDQAEDDYREYVELNSTDSEPSKDGGTTYTTSPFVWTVAEAKKEIEIDRCYR